MSSLRQKKYERLLLKEISLLIQNSYSNLFPGTMVSVTFLKISPDFSFAKVYVSFFGKISHEDGLAILKENKIPLRTQLGKLIRHQVRKVPEINFYIDDSQDLTDRINKALS